MDVWGPTKGKRAVGAADPRRRSTGLRSKRAWTSIAAMHRPSRQHQHLLEKIARKESRAQSKNRKAGSRLKQWKKWAEAYKPLAAAQA